MRPPGFSSATWAWGGLGWGLGGTCFSLTFFLDGRRKVNIDPGYMDLFKLVLASAKFQGQKICLGKGVYADPTLYYDKGWKSYDWSFPDFKSGRYDEFLAGVRRSYKNKMRNMRDRDGKDEY